MALVYEKETYQILGACFEVYKELGCGFLEAVYQEALMLELDMRQIPFLAKPKLKLWYKERQLKQAYYPDLICFDKIILELKAVAHLGPDHRAQLQNYLHATGFKLGFLLNFGHYPKLEYERIIC